MLLADSRHHIILRILRTIRFILKLRIISTHGIEVLRRGDIHALIGLLPIPHFRDRLQLVLQLVVGAREVWLLLQALVLVLALEKHFGKKVIV